ncbi:hypothetical protein BU24DRAFT_490502 [Aaosphaeria arxii CBS 175.79]|uniref:RING-type domain-containing protein n=1 Tax=Aaosphaeria arxii CBS 175.79 TaxID=1450172 RepID=A0A6A5XWG4_9PLEO|nr:uncharacterized protein BU24DRAFT_490502 [Aaosphaeria arxii CBS 175.79]KAF2017309.1 hypothetical protein BU24DRAFT_490502 [Aaosphaeria arxii CBS 175.79]
MNESTKDFYFRGGGNIMEAHHMTRYVYPCLFDYHKSQLLMPAPRNASQRSRPQGRGQWDNTFISISPVQSKQNRPPTLEKFKATLSAQTRQQDCKSRNSLGRAMARISCYEGNTTLEAGKIKLKDGPYYIIRRTTAIRLAHGETFKAARETQTYHIPVNKWKDLKPNSSVKHDCWWQRLQDLFTSSFDRAWWNTIDQFENVLHLPSPQTQWLPRNDIIECGIRPVPSPKKLPPDQKDCPSCLDTFFTEAGPAYRFPCDHFLCLTCSVSLIDAADKNKLGPEDVNKYPDGPFIRCPTCRFFISVGNRRIDFIRPDEVKFWRWRTVIDALENMLTRDLVGEINFSQESGYIPPFSLHNREQPDIALGVRDAARAHIRSEHLTDWMMRVPVYAASLQPWGHDADNPTRFPESKVLHAALIEEFNCLEQARTLFTIKELMGHLTRLGDWAVYPRLRNLTDNQRQHNPMYPPGFETYLIWLCEWISYGAFIRPTARSDLYRFLERMDREKGVWWKGHPFLRKA